MSHPRATQLPRHERVERNLKMVYTNEYTTETNVVGLTHLLTVVAFLRATLAATRDGSCDVRTIRVKTLAVFRTLFDVWASE